MYEIKILTRDFILQHVSEIDIFKRYGLVVKFTGIQLNPYRRKKTDKRPSLSFFNHNKTNRIWFKDFGNDYWKGDCFNFVEKRFSLTHGQALFKIATDFGIVDAPYEVSKNPLGHYEEVIDTLTQFKVVARKYTLDDKAYWKRYGVDTRILKKFQIYAIQSVHKQNKTSGLYEQVYTYRNHDPCYGILNDYDEELDVQYWRFSFPNRDELRFITNSYDLMGVRQLPHYSDVILITKSFKDMATIDSFNYASVAVPTEADLPKLEWITNLRKKGKILLSFYDWDEAGKAMAFRVFKEYNILPIFTKSTLAKDPSDFIFRFGRGLCNNRIENLKSSVKEMMLARGLL